MLVQSVDEMSPIMRKPVLPYMNNKGAGQSAHPCSLISAFVVHFLDSIIPLVFYIQNFKTLASFCSWAGRIESHLVGNPEDRFSRGVAQLFLCLIQM